MSNISCIKSNCTRGDIRLKRCPTVDKKESISSGIGGEGKRKSLGWQIASAILSIAFVVSSFLGFFLLSVESKSY